ncbi:MAG: P-II family nitrogen regulator [Eubacteriales bacterium]|nr:P-II family nitrogen regulator [Eubacteriales bacterium]
MAIDYDLIVTIVSKGSADDVVDAAKTAGAEGATIIGGRGTGVHEHSKLFGMMIEPQKDIVLTLIPANITEKVLSSISDAVGLEKPGKGIAFVLDVKRTAGICHLCAEMLRLQDEGSSQD